MRKNENMGKIFGGAFILSLIILLYFLFLGPKGRQYLSLLPKLFFINAGNDIITFTVMWLIIGVWR
jgi:heme/copper-type cytochrome/quinol oxidase subunit 4